MTLSTTGLKGQKFLEIAKDMVTELRALKNTRVVVDVPKAM